MEEFVVLYILYPNLENPKEVLYLKKESKEKAPKIIWDKLVGIGGKIEKIDGKNEKRIFAATRREIQEELGIRFEKNHTIIYCGKVYRKEQDIIIYFLKTFLEEKISPKYIENEGKCNYFPINYHQKNPKEFPQGDVKILDKIFFSNEFFNEIIN